LFGDAKKSVGEITAESRPSRRRVALEDQIDVWWQRERRRGAAPLAVYPERARTASRSSGQWLLRASRPMNRPR
jgi:hypothetical protein